MYTKDKLNRITLRLNEEQFNFVKSQADLLAVTPSEFLRMVVNLTMLTTSKAQEQIIAKLQQGGAGRENDKADNNNLV